MITKVKGVVIDHFTETVEGSVPPPVTASGKYLKDDGTWDSPSATNGYGHIYGRGGRTDAASVSVGTFTTFGVDIATTWASGLLNGMTRTDDKLYSTGGGIYFFTLSLSVPWINAVNCKLGLSLDGAQPDDQRAVTYGSSGNAATDRANPTLTGIIELTGGQYVQPMATTLVTPRDINSTGVELTMVKVA